jgi:hypothetical protein
MAITPLANARITAHQERMAISIQIYAFQSAMILPLANLFSSMLLQDYINAYV